MDRLEPACDNVAITGGIENERAIASASAAILICAGCTAAVQNDSTPQASADTETVKSTTLTKEMEMEIMDFSKEKKM